MKDYDQSKERFVELPFGGGGMPDICQLTAGELAAIAKKVQERFPVPTNENFHAIIAELLYSTSRVAAAKAWGIRNVSYILIPN